MENKIKNPVSKKNIFFFNIFNRLIDSIENYVHKTEEDTFAENFDVLKEDSMISIMPKGSTVEKLTLGDGFSRLRVVDENFAAHIEASSSDNWIELFATGDNKNVNFSLTNETIRYIYHENNNDTGNIIFDKNGIAVGTNGTTYNIYESQLSTIVNACEYSYDENNSIYFLNLFPNAVNNITDFPRRIILYNPDQYFSIDDEGFNIYSISTDNDSKLTVNKTFISLISNNNYNSKFCKIDLLSNGYVEITQSDSEYGQIIKFTDNIGVRNVSFTFDELVALKAMLPTT